MRSKKAGSTFSLGMGGGNQAGGYSVATKKYGGHGVTPPPFLRGDRSFLKSLKLGDSNFTDKRGGIPKRGGLIIKGGDR